MIVPTNTLSRSFDLNCSNGFDLVRSSSDDQFIWDIETAGDADEDRLREIHKPFKEFDPSDVKCGNLGAEKAAEKIEAARLKHAEDENAYWEEKREKMALSPLTGKVLTIGYLPLLGDESDAVLDDGDGCEKTLLQRFWGVYDLLCARKGKIIGWNSGAGRSFGFDLGFLVKRSWINQVPVPPTVYSDQGYISNVFVDAMNIWTLFEYREFAKLDFVAKVLGIGTKSNQEVTGATFAEFFARGGEDKQKAIYYGKLDLVLTRDVYNRLRATSELPFSLDGEW